MQTVRQLLNKKGQQIIAVTPDSSVYDAIKTMAAHEIGAVLVTDGDQLIGILSERDYARKIILMGRRSRETAVREIMSSNLITVTLEHTLEQCMTLMTDKRIRHLPVIGTRDDDGKLLGIVSIGDAVKSIISNHEFTIQQLESYITGSEFGT